LVISSVYESTVQFCLMNESAVVACLDAGFAGQFSNLSRVVDYMMLLEFLWQNSAAGEKNSSQVRVVHFTTDRTNGQMILGQYPDIQYP
jgi:hypothetical protein